MLEYKKIRDGGKMVVIEVEENDLDAVFEILSSNGKFVGLPDNRFRIDENAEETLKTISDAGIKVKVINKEEESKAEEEKSSVEEKGEGD